MGRRIWVMGWLSALLALVGCDSQRIAELEEGVASEADVRARFGSPDNLWDEPGGVRVLEYNRQPEGMRNYMISIGADGKMSALRQVLTPENFARITPGMSMEAVRRQLGQPLRKVPLALKNETYWDWRYLEPPSTARIFTVYFNADLRVVRTQTAPDTDSTDRRG